MSLVTREYLNRNGKRMPASVFTHEKPRGTFVLLHGLGGWKDQRIMKRVRDAVATSGYSYIAFDAADGANAPDADPLQSTPTGVLHDLEDVVSLIKEDPWFTGPLSIGGLSLGGLVAAEYAARNPDAVARLLLIAPAITWRIYRPLVPVGLVWFVYGKIRFLDRDLKHYWLGRKWVLDFMRYDGFKSARSVAADTLVVIAERDGLVGTLATHLRYAKLFRKGTSVIISKSTHTFHPYEDVLAATITPWLTSS